MLRKVIFTCTHGFRPGGEEMKYAAKQNWMLQMYAFAAKMSHTRHNHLTQQTPYDGSICASCAGPSPEAHPTHSIPLLLVRTYLSTRVCPVWCAANGAPFCYQCSAQSGTLQCMNGIISQSYVFTLQIHQHTDACGAFERRLVHAAYRLCCFLTIPYAAKMQNWWVVANFLSLPYALHTFGMLLIETYIFKQAFRPWVTWKCCAGAVHRPQATSNTIH